MHDAVGEVLAQRKALDRGAGAGIALSLVLHGAITAAAVYAALRHTPEQNVPMVQIKFAPAAPAPKPAAAAVAATPAPKPQPVVPPAPVPLPAPLLKPVVKPVAASPYGKSTKKPTPA